MKKGQKFYLFIKRIIGFLGSILGIIFCFSLFWWWIIVINLFITKGKPFYIQKRYGKHKKVFGLIKFRSMRVDAPEVAPSELTKEKQYQMETKFGHFLRRTSLDETPQLFNIFVGQMAFIGPRPGAAHNEELLVQQRESYTPSAFEVKPGLSGLAQLNMHRMHDPEEKAKFDHEYVKNISFWLDIKIFVLTLFSVFGSGKGK